MEPRTQFQKRCDLSVHFEGPTAGRRKPRKQFQQGALSGSVPSYDSDTLSHPYLK